MTKALDPGSTIGILGGGQLGRMLAMAAARFSYRTVILEPDAACPAAQLATRQITAAYDDPEALDELASISDVVTYEFENVPVTAARRLVERVQVHPGPAALEVAQDRLLEKQHLNRFQVPTARFASVESEQDLGEALRAFGGEGVLKTRRFGYDGKGQRILRKGERPPGDLFAAMGKVPLILEEFVAYRCEFSIVAARAQDGSFAAYDAARNLHREGILRTSTVPAGIPGTAVAAASDHTRRLAESLGYVGVIGVEFFLREDGSIAANEFAPRVHNSGHWTEAACTISQFEQHIRAIAGLPLGSTRRHSDCEMHNLIGEAAADIEQIAGMADTLVHLYGKAEIRAGRKMGHFTTLKNAPPIR